MTIIRLVHNSIRDIKTWDQELNSIVLFVYNLKILQSSIPLWEMCILVIRLGMQNSFTFMAGRAELCLLLLSCPFAH